jgi:hypothetical protein
MKLGDLIAGNDHTKTIGNYRVYVTCDDRIAVYWGVRNFGENKVMTHPFLFNVPSPNNPDQTGWAFTVPGTIDEAFGYDPAKPLQCDPFIYALDFDASNVAPKICNPSEIIDYSLIRENGAMRPVGSRRNVFGPFLAYDLAKVAAKRAILTYGNSRHPLVELARSLLGAQPVPVAAQSFQSQPVVAESSLYYVDV